MALSLPSHATSNGSQATQQPSRSLQVNNPCSSTRDDIPQWSQRQGINSLPSEVGLSPNDQTHIVPSTHPHVPAAVSNFEDGEVYASPLVVAVRDSPSRLTWADQASNGDFIPKEALDVEEEYGGFSANSDFLLYVDAQLHGTSDYEGSTKGGTGRGELPVRAKLASSQNLSSQISSAESGMAQAMLGCSDKAYSPTQHAPTTAAAFHQLLNANSSTVDMFGRDELPTRATLASPQNSYPSSLYSYAESRMAHAQANCSEKAYTPTPASSATFQHLTQGHLSLTVDKSSQTRLGLSCTIDTSAHPQLGPLCIVDTADSALYATENSRLPQSYSVLQQNTQATPLHTNSSISVVASQANSTCPLVAAPFHMQGDALATNYANRQAFRSSKVLLASIQWRARSVMGLPLPTLHQQYALGRQLRIPMGLSQRSNPL
ncbi:hypothetical protein F0562_029661 [Nyssa sinensis]|uniref:Uncharacterized protein n=1 Tax=Nyssa sinensis TaxID=561372 RepID=A0A5J5B5Y1_9ASTE|nr:hypothetical protein F0562_029661 [Nyssa sinensis]